MKTQLTTEGTEITEKTFCFAFLRALRVLRGKPILTYDY
jgi:hypothetical protein